MGSREKAPKSESELLFLYEKRVRDKNENMCFYRHYKY
jgi:hypothetical protein